MGAPRKPLVTIHDAALPRARFEQLATAIEALGRERIVAGYQTTFWFDFSAEPSSLVEREVLTLRELVPAKVRARAIGVEWWLSRMRTSNVKVDFHRDRDNALWDQQRREANPVLGSLLYLGSCRGGLLAVTKEPPNAKNPAFAPDVHDFDFVEPRANRFAFFDGRLTHGVLDAKNQIPGARLPTERTWRRAIAINFWDRRPLDVPGFAASAHYRRLRLTRLNRSS